MIQLRKAAILFSLLFVLTPFRIQEVKAQVNIIFDTDFGGDADDLGALAMLNHFQNKKEINLLAVMGWNTELYSVSAIDATNTYYGNPDIPIGVRKDGSYLNEWNHSKVIADNLEHDATYENAPEATSLYRKLLSESDDKGIVIVTVGPLENIKRLIESESDEYSSLNGMELINQKVSEFVIMGGNFPTSTNEWNFDGGMPGVTRFVLEKLETPVTFLGAELGSSLKTGEIFNDLPSDSPLYLGFYHFSKYAPWVKDNFTGNINDNSTFDQTAVLYAIRDGVGTYWDRVENGICVADSTGGNTWEPKENSNHSYLVLKKPRIEMEQELEAFMIGNF
ncbi:MAG: nucleoside hydrolase [Balneolaceae bacterium]